MKFESQPSDYPAAQPPPRPSRSARRGPRWWVIALFAIPLVVLLLIIGVWVGVTTFLRGDSFRKLVTVETNKAFKAEGDYEKFSWTGSTVYSPGYQATGEQGGYFESLAAATLRAEVELDGVKRGFWTIRNMEIGSLNLELGAPKEFVAREELSPTSAPPLDSVIIPTGDESRPDTAEQVVTYNPTITTTETVPVVAKAVAEEKKNDEKAKKTHFYDAWLPSDLELMKVTVREARVAWSPMPEQAGHLAGTRMELTPLVSTDIKQGWEVRGSEGTFQQAGLAEFDIVDYQIRAKSDEVYIHHATLRGPQDCRIEASGNVVLDPEVNADVRVKMAGYPLSEILEGDWKKRLEGRLSGEVHLTGAPTSPDAVAIGNLYIEDGVLQGLPVLEQIAKYTKTDRFLRMTLDEASTDFRHQGDVVDVTNLKMESKGLMKLTGNARIDKNTMDGTFRVGVTSASLRWLPGAEKRVFTESAEGYLWTTMKVTGKVDSPVEDLTPRLIQAAGEELVSTVEGVADELKKGADDNTKKVIDKASDLLKSLFK